MPLKTDRSDTTVVFSGSLNEPFLLHPHLAERVWGGNRLGPQIGEAWDLSTHPHGLAVIGSGSFKGQYLVDVVAAHPEAFGGSIELLGKRLDCAESLSVQVHPSTGDAKTEAWVVLEAQEGAGIFLGFKHRVSAEEVARRAQDGSLPEILAFTEVNAGEVIYVPAGTVHAIGGGLVLFELQQASDTTYRLFDWGRSGRELHLSEGLACAELDVAPPRPVVRQVAPGVEELLRCPWFEIDRLSHNPSVSGHDAEQFVISPGARWRALLVVAGQAEIAGLTLRAGATVMVPTTAGPTSLVAQSDFLALSYGPPHERDR